MKPARPNFLLILRTLSGRRVDFIVVGGVCAVLHGAPLATFDLDLVHSREPDNVERLMTALEELDAYYRGQGGRVIRPDGSHLSSPGHQLLMTKAGPLDLLGVIGKGRGYEKLLKHTVEASVSGDVTVRLLDLETLIETKQEAAREKDRAVLAILRQTLEEKRRRRKG